MVYPELNPARVHVVMVEMGPHLLAPFDDSLRQYTLRELVKRGVDVRLNTAISEVHPDQVDFKDGDVDAGRPGDLGGRRVGLPVAARAGVCRSVAAVEIEVNSDLRTTNDDRVFAVGDASLIVDNPLPQLAQPALQRASTPRSRSSG